MEKETHRDPLPDDMRTVRGKNVTCSHWYYLEGGGVEVGMNAGAIGMARKGWEIRFTNLSFIRTKMSHTLFIAFYYGRQFMTEEVQLF